jgi:lipopolysaccharide/colanic/teichoic acid biosynthesis glycosyltransferase/acetyltransferase-like isoleucine patch superfamily enzyme
MVSNGRFAADVNHNRLSKLLNNLRADVVAINVAPELQAGCDKVLISQGNRIVGFCRYYEDTVQQAPCNDWPHLLFINTNALDVLVTSNIFCLSFSCLVEKTRSSSLNFRSTRVAGELLDLNSREGLLDYLETHIDTGTVLSHGQSGFEGNSLNRNGIKIDRSTMLTGKVLLGRNVTIESNVVIIGPVIIGDNVTIERDAFIKTSIIVPSARVEREQIVDSAVVTSEAADLHDERAKSIPAFTKPDRPANLIRDVRRGGRVRSSRYRTWPRFSYVGCFKRLADILAAIVMLILFAPVLPVIALAVKLTNPGPVLFKDKRQGLHGKTFDCMKFRTMIVGADKIQRKLRVVSQVDGPQFKMKNDPRVSRVGQFLRDTYIDEIPQFINVLLGQMSVVGPRPSPESENTMCAYWRDARLSVRPGLTGLWQIRRTRQAMKDFQEWIHYDTEYIRSISFKLDMQICWETFKKMVMNFAQKF